MTTEHSPLQAGLPLRNKETGDEKDIEQASGQHDDQSTSNEPIVSQSKRFRALSAYLFCNIVLTMYNKALLGAISIPWILTAVHAGSAWLGCLIALKLGYFQMSKLTISDQFRLLAFSMLFTVNIAISNVSLSMVTIPFHQIARATCPFFTTLIYRLFFSRRFSLAIYLSLLPVTLGVVITTFGNITYTSLGFVLTFLGVILAAVKTITTNRVLTGPLALGHWELLFRLSSLAFFQTCIIAFALDETQSFRQYIAQKTQTSSNFSTGTTSVLLTFAGNGFLAFLLNLSSFNANKLTGALTMTVCANVKQCATTVLGFCLFDVTLTPHIVYGVTMTLVGSAAYNLAEMHARKDRPRGFLMHSKN